MLLKPGWFNYAGAFQKISAIATYNKYQFILIAGWWRASQFLSCNITRSSAKCAYILREAIAERKVSEKCWCKGLVLARNFKSFAVNIILNLHGQSVRYVLYSFTSTDRIFSCREFVFFFTGCPSVSNLGAWLVHKTLWKEEQEIWSRVACSVICWRPAAFFVAHEKGSRETDHKKRTKKMYVRSRDLFEGLVVISSRRDIWTRVQN